MLLRSAPPYRINKRRSVRCPICKRTGLVGQIGENEFYCRGCIVEFHQHADGSITLYRVLDDGSAKELRPQAPNTQVTQGVSSPEG